MEPEPAAAGTPSLCRGRGPVCNTSDQMEAIYRIVSQADGTFAVERTEPGKEAVVSGAAASGMVRSTEADNL